MTESHGRVFSRIVNLHFAIPFLILYLHSIRMDGVAQLVRASVCGSEGRGFETHRGPQKLSKKAPKYRSFFYAFLEDLNTDYFKKFPYPFIKTPSSFYVTFFFNV